MTQPAWPARVAGLDTDEFLSRAELLHGHISPGVVAGGFLVQAAGELHPPGEYVNAVAESVVCLPDAVQILTPCSLGNGYLQVLDWGKFAVTLYDRQSLAGARAWLDPELVAGFPVIAGWYLRPQNGVKVDKEVVVRELLAHGPELVRSSPVELDAALKPTAKVPTGPCPECGETYPLRQGRACLACQGQAYYRYSATGLGGS
jgi:formylmethanofuran dehydrogenase subunit E